MVQLVVLVVLVNQYNQYNIYNMSNSVHKIRRALLIPFAVDIFLLFVLILFTLFAGGSPIEKIVLFIIFIPLLCIFLESISREVTTRDDGIKIKKLLRKKDLNWGNITNVGTIIIRKKVYLLLTTTKGFYVLSNSYEKFTALVQTIVDNVDKENVDEEVQDLIEHPVKKISNIISAWLAAIVLLAVIYIKMFHL